MNDPELFQHFLTDPACSLRRPLFDIANPVSTAKASQKNNKRLAKPVEPATRLAAAYRHPVSQRSALADHGDGRTS